MQLGISITQKIKKSAMQALIGAVFVSASAAAGAQSSALPTALQTALKSGDAELVNQFEAESGLAGYVVRVNGKMSIVYATKSGHLLVGSSLISPAGENLTQAHLEKHVPKPDFSKFWGDLSKTTTIVEGDPDGKNPIYVFLDPNCGFCHLMWLATRPYVAAGATVKWVPVAFLVREGPNASDKKNAFMLNSKNPAEALALLKENFKKTLPVQMPTPTASQQQLFKKNSELMGKFGFSGTPAIVWKDESGEVRVLAGMPRMPELAKILRMKEMVQTAPELAQFK